MFFSQVIVGAITPILIFFLLKLAGNKKVMGNYRAHWLSLAAGWLTIAILVTGDIFLIYYLI